MRIHRHGRTGGLTVVLIPLCLFLVGAVFQSAPQAHAEAVTGTITVGNSPWGVAYDSGAGEMFVANSGGSVSVINDATDASSKIVTGLNGPIGVAYDSGKGEIFVANQGAGTVSVICDGTIVTSFCTGSTTTNKVVATLGPAVSGLPCEVGEYSTCPGLNTANAVAYDSRTNETFVTTGDCPNAGPGTSVVCSVYVISDSTNAVVAAIPIGSSPGYATGLAYDSGAGEVFVPIYNSGKVQVICDGTNTNICSSGANTVATTIALPSGSSPEVIAYDSGKGEIFVANSGGTVLVYCDGTNAAACPTPDTLVATVAFGSNLNPGIAYDPRTGEIFVSVLSYYVSVISDSTNTVTGTMYVGLGPYGIAYDSGKGETFTAVTDANSVAVISDPTLTLAPSGVSSGGSTTLSGSNYLSSSLIDSSSCTISSSYIYCVGGNTGSGYTSAVYYAQVSSSGVGSWTSTAAYPINIFGSSCAISSGYIYCAGGYTGSALAPTTTSAVYYASVSSTGVGPWTTSTAYPSNIVLESCASLSGYIYCVGGYTGSAYTTAVYYAQVSSSGVGSWTSTTAYHTGLYGASCAIDSGSGYMFCVGGFTGSSYLNSVYDAQVSSGGVGSWSSTTAYPTTVYVGSCAASSGYIYCAAGYTGSTYTNAVYYAQVSSSGAGTWTSTGTYPATVDRESCATSSGYIYCIGGNDGSGFISGVYYASVSSGGVGSWTSTGLYGARTYNYCFESGVTSAPSACPSTNQFAQDSSGSIPASTTLTVSGTTGLVVVSDTATGAVVSSALITISADPTVSVAPAGPLTYDVAQTASTLTASVTYTGPDTTSVEWYSSSTSSCSASSTDTHTSGLAFSPVTSSTGTTYYCAVVSDSGVSGYESASNAVEVTVDTALSAGAIAPATPAALDDGQTIAANPSGGTTPYVSYQWYASSDCSTSPVPSGGSSSIYTPTASGTYYYKVTDSASASACSAGDAVTVNPALTGATVTISASPSAIVGSGSTTITVSWTGGAGTPDYSVQLQTSSFASCSGPTNVGSPKAGIAGASTTFSVSPSSTTIYCATVTDSATTPESAATATGATVTVSALPTMTLTPAHGPVGISVSVSGTGFSASTGIGTFTYGGITPATQTCTSQTTSAAGAFSCTFTVPSSSGPQTVAAWGSDHISVPTDTASAIFTASTLTLVPSRGAAGTSVTLSGSGYADGYTYNYCYEADTQSGGACSSSLQLTTNSSGSIPGSVSVAASGSLNGLVVVSDPATGEVITSAPFTVTTGAVQVSTVTAVACDPSTIVERASTICTAIVTGSSATGTVTFSAGSGSFSPNAACVLTTLTSPSSCFTTFVGPSSVGAVTIGASYSGDSTNQASSESTASVSVIAVTPSAFSLSCASSSIVIGATTSCTINVAPTSLAGTVGFSTSNENGILSIDTCTLSSGSCSVSLIGATAGTLTVTAALAASSSTTLAITITSPTNGAVTGSAETHVGAGGSTGTTTITGTAITLAVANTGAAVGTSVGAVGQVLRAPTQTSSTPGLTSPVYVDVLVGGVTTGTATICVTDASANSQTTMQFWTGSAWESSADVTVSGTSVCGQIPVADLAGTNIAVGQPQVYLVVLPSTVTTFACPSSTVTIGTFLTCTLTVTSSASAPSGIVTFYSAPESTALGLQSSCLLAPTLSASAKCSVTIGPSPGAVSSYTVVASYSGDPSHASSSGRVSLVVQDPTTTAIVCSSSEVTVGSSTTCTVTVEDTLTPSSIPTAFVLLSGPSSLGANIDSGCTLDESGTCSIVLTPTSAGTYAINGQYIGDETHASSQGLASITVTAVTTTETSTTTSTTTSSSTSHSASSTTSSTTTSTTSTISTPSSTTEAKSSSSSTVTETVTISSSQTTATSTTTTPSRGVGPWLYLLAGILAAAVVLSFGILVLRRRVAREYGPHGPQSKASA